MIGRWRQLAAGQGAEIYGLKFSGYSPGGCGRHLLSKLPGFQKKVRVMLDWTLDLLFSKAIVQLPTLRLTNDIGNRGSAAPVRNRLPHWMERRTANVIHLGALPVPLWLTVSGELS